MTFELQENKCHPMDDIFTMFELQEYKYHPLDDIRMTFELRSQKMYSRISQLNDI